MRSNYLELAAKILEIINTFVQKGVVCTDISTHTEIQLM